MRTIGSATGNCGQAAAETTVAAGGCCPLPHRVRTVSRVLEIVICRCLCGIFPQPKNLGRRPVVCASGGMGCEQVFVAQGIEPGLASVEALNNQ